MLKSLVTVFTLELVYFFGSVGNLFLREVNSDDFCSMLLAVFVGIRDEGSSQ